MSNASGDQRSPSREGVSENPYGLRFQLPEHPGQLAGWVAQIDKPPTVEELPSMEELRDLLHGKIRTPQEHRDGRARLLILVVALMASVCGLFLIHRYLRNLISLG